jgi:hypothetical protein
VDDVKAQLVFVLKVGAMCLGIFLAGMGAERCRVGP